MRRSSALWIQNHPSGARVVLAPGGESRELAAAVLAMVKDISPRDQGGNSGVSGQVAEKLRGFSRPRSGFEITRNPVRLARTRGPCSCGDCLGCDVQTMKREHQERKAAHGH